MAISCLHLNLLFLPPPLPHTHTLVPHICAKGSGQHTSDNGLSPNSSPSHYLNQCWVIVNWTLRNELQLIFNQNTNLFIHENASEKFVCEMAAISSRERWVKINIAWHAIIKPYGMAFFMGELVLYKPALVQIMAWRRLGDKPLSEACWPDPLTHIHGTRERWV